ncbi:MAG: hypothetical protein DI596_10955, partial [Azospira oryzae]
MKAEEIRPVARGRWGEILAALAPHLIPALERKGRHMPCPVHGGRDGYRVFKDVDETGGSVCNTCGVFPDGFATLMWANGWDFPTALRAVAGYLCVGTSTGRPARKVKPEPQKGEDDEKLRQALNRVWNESIPIMDRDAEPARLYLARRGISIRPPETIRFHPSLAYYDGDKKAAGGYPAIIAMVTGAQGNPVTIHRTYLTPDGKKAPVESPKKLMAYPKDRRIVGGAIRLVEAGSVLAVAEGLETSLAVLEGTGLPVWCAVNAYLLEHLVPPESVRRVIVFADKDRATEQHPRGHGQEAARRLVQRLWEMGIKASAIV